MKATYLPAILWASCILIATTTYNFQSLLFAGEIGFNIRLSPRLADLFIINDIRLDSKSYVFQKIGHAISFGILYLLLARGIGDNRKSILLCIQFAFFTEFLQLFFERSGRLADVFIDIGGIYLAHRLSMYVKKQRKLYSAFLKSGQKMK